MTNANVENKEKEKTPNYKIYTEVNNYKKIK